MKQLALTYLVGIGLGTTGGVLGDAVTGFDWSPLLNMGGVGLVLVWFLWKAEPRMRAIESAIDRNSRSILILLLEISRTTPEAKIQANAVVTEIEKAEEARK